MSEILHPLPNGTKVFIVAMDDELNVVPGTVQKSWTEHGASYTHEYRIHCVGRQIYSAVKPSNKVYLTIADASIALKQALQVEFNKLAPQVERLRSRIAQLETIIAKQGQ